MNESMILKEEIDPNYVPTQEEILEFAEYIGLELPEDQDLLYLAKEGLVAPLPPNWEPCMTKENEVYYFNFETGESEWEHPCDEKYKQEVKEIKAARRKRSVEENRKKKPLDLIEKVNESRGAPEGMLNDIIEVDESELKKRKTQIEEEFKRETEKIREEYKEHLKKYKKKIDVETEEEITELKEDYEADEVIERKVFENNLKIKKKEVEEYFEGKEKIRIEEERKKLHVNQNTKEEKIEILKQKLKGETEETLFKEERKIRDKIEDLQREIKKFESQIQWNTEEKAEIEKRKQNKIERIKEDLEENTELEKVKIKRKLEMNSEIPELSESDKAELQMMKSSLESQFQNQIQTFRSQYEHKLLSLQSESTKLLQSRLQHELEEYLSKYRHLKESHQSEDNLESLHLQEEINELEFQLKIKEQTFIDLSRSLTTTPKPEEQRIQLLEREVSSLKKIITRHQSEKKYRPSFRIEQKMHPDFSELRKNTSDVFKAVRTRGQSRNEADKEFASAEGWIEHDETSIEDRPSEPPARESELKRQPWQVHNFNIYERKVNEWTKERNIAQAAISRHGTWLSNIRDDLSKIRFSTLRPLYSFR